MKIQLGLIALSGVRCQNKELLELGLNLPGFVERSQVVASLPSLGLLTLAALTPDDFEIHYIEIPDLDALDSLPGPFDLVAISSFTAMMPDAYALSRQYKEVGTKVVLGGLHVTLAPQEAIEYADGIVIGEAENMWPKLLADFKSNKLKEVYDGRKEPLDMAKAPIPRFDLLQIENYNRLTVQTQRGCPFRCDFCASSIHLSRRYKNKPVELVEREIDLIQSIWSRPFIEFADDNTFANKAYGKKLAKMLQRKNARWFSETDISIAEDTDLLKALRDSGCAQLLIGLESPEERQLGGIELNNNWKQKQRPKYLESIQKIQDHGITVNGCFVLGLDGCDESSFESVWEFVNESGLFEVQITLMTPFPGTALWNRLLDENRIIDPNNLGSCTLFDINFKPDKMTVSELDESFKKLASKIYTEEFNKMRKRKFFDRLSSIRAVQKQES